MELINVASSLRQEMMIKGPTSVAVRKERLKSFKQTILEHEQLINKALKVDLGKSDFETYTTEIGFILEEISYILSGLESWTGTRKVKTPLTLFPGASFIYPEPYGVVLIISPWNYPFQLCLAPFLGAVAAGNRVVVKPSEMAPETSKVLRFLISEVFPKDEVVVVEGGLEETQILLKQRFDYIFFTGSTLVGKVIMKAAAEYLTPVTLELGGKSPCLILESANIDVAAKRCAWGKFINAGQTCVAPDYVVIPKNLQEQFIERMRHHLNTFYGSDPGASEDYPRIVNSKHFNRLAELLVPEKIAIGGKTNANEKYFGPTVMKDVAWDDQVMKDEIFGPILPILTYDNLDEAIQKINSLPKPLAFYVFTENGQMGQEVISKVSFGGGCINDTVVHLANPHLPFGGVGTSGIGSYHGQKSFDTFTHFKSVYRQGTSVDIPLRYPPYKKKLGWIKFFIR